MQEQGFVLSRLKEPKDKDRPVLETWAILED